MRFDRRDFLKGGTAIAASAALPSFAFGQTFAPQPGAWRQFEVLTRLEVACKESGVTQAWVPLPSVNEKDWFKSGESTWTTNGKAAVATDASGARFLHATFAKDEKAPIVEVSSKVATRDRAVDFNKPGKATPLTKTERNVYTRSTQLIPTTGIVKEASDRIVANAHSEIEKVRAIYEWVVDNTYRDAKVRGCGIGDIAMMLKSNAMGGKCADINALFVGLVRAQGIPARDVYGIRIAPSNFGYKSLGANSEVITKAQHCRAEVFIAGHGWVATDPADVRKVILEEPPTNLAMLNPKVAAARKTLFGSWEGNWLAYNFAHDVALPGSNGPKLGFLMYPQAETAGLRCDCLDPDSFKYTITSRELTAA
ncbi:MAG: twin-arginine translocation signal domain-containing protein [Pseudolabrys sp.]|nr:twin-arginine translocation signal domain-containing protein [Pseudolabrys sp.]